MKLTLRTLVLLGIAGATSAFGQSFIDDASPASGQSGVFAYWNFNNLGITGTAAVAPGTNGLATSIASDFGTASLSLANYGGLVDDFAGSAINAQSSAPAEESLSLVSGGVSGGPYPGNGSYIQFSFSMTNLAGLDIDFATRGTSSGFSSGVWSYSTDGVSFTTFGTNTATTGTSFVTASPTGIALTALDNVSTAYLRYTVSGATSSSGNNRIDNITLSATYSPVPEPSSFAALAGLGALGFCALRRRRSA